MSSIGTLSSCPAPPKFPDCFALVLLTARTGVSKELCHALMSHDSQTSQIRNFQNVSMQEVNSRKGGQLNPIASDLIGCVNGTPYLAPYQVTFLISRCCLSQRVPIAPVILLFVQSHNCSLIH